MKKAKDIQKHPAHVTPREKQGDFGGIKIAVRFRPLTDTERKRGKTSVWGVDEVNNVGVIFKRNFSPKYHYDTVFQQDTDNMFIYETIASEIVSKAMGGINGTIFAYGGSNSGKTHTMFGSKGEMGIIQRVIQNVFELMKKSLKNEYRLRLSMLEIYNEKLNDLLDTSRTNLKIMENHSKSVHVENLTEVVLEYVEQALILIETGNANRTVFTDYIVSIIALDILYGLQMSAVSSKNESRNSHTLCRISIEVNDNSGSSGARRLSFLNLVDVASFDSARDASLGNKTERSFNNKSLLTLRTVIYRLSNFKRSNTHIPYRDGKLTRLLRSQLTGTGDRVVMICCISPVSSQKTETHNTLKFASQAEKIGSKEEEEAEEVTEEEEVTSEEPLFARYQREIAHLKMQLKEMSEESAVSEPTNYASDPRLQEELTNMRERLEEELYARMQREDDRITLNMRIDRLTRLILHSNKFQAEDRSPVYNLTRSQSCNDLMKAQSNFEDRVQRGFLGDMNTSFPEDLNPPPSSSNLYSFGLEINNPFNSSELKRNYDLGIEDLREELIILKKAMADREKELELKNRETEELLYVRIELQQMQKKLQEYESGTFLNEKLPLRNDGFVRSLSQSSSASTSTTESKLSRIEFSPECPHSVDEKPLCPPLNFVSEGDGPLESSDNSPTASMATTDSKLSATPFCVEKSSMDMEIRSLRPPLYPVLRGSSDQPMSSAEMHAKVERLASEVRQAFEELATKETQIETQRTEIVGFKDEAVSIREQLRNLASENERLKMRIHTMTSEQDRTASSSEMPFVRYPVVMGTRTSNLSLQQVYNCVGLDLPSNRTTALNDLHTLYDTYLGDDS
eukprot:g5477.t1